MTQKQQTILAREYLMFLLLAAFPALVGLIAHLEDHAPIAVIVGESAFPSHQAALQCSTSFFFPIHSVDCVRA